MKPDRVLRRRVAKRQRELAQQAKREEDQKRADAARDNALAKARQPGFNGRAALLARLLTFGPYGRIY